MNNNINRLLKIGLKEEDNPQYFDIITIHNQIIAEWDRFNKIILKMKLHY